MDTYAITLAQEPTIQHLPQTGRKKQTPECLSMLLNGFLAPPSL